MREFILGRLAVTVFYCISARELIIFQTCQTIMIPFQYITNDLLIGILIVVNVILTEFN
jgi:hypothetical protein